MKQPTIQFPLPDQEIESAEDKNHNPYIVAAILALSIVVLLFYRLSSRQEALSPALVGPNGKSNQIIVDVDGAVVRPGVYRLRVGSRVFDAVASAGGLRSDADKRQVNMAKKLQDEDKLFIPRLGGVLPSPSASPSAGEPPSDIPSENPAAEDPPEASPPPSELTPAPEIASPSPSPTPVPEANREPSPQGERVSINRASVDQLEIVPGLNSGLAVEIVNYRKGPPPRAFTSLEELTLVPGLASDKYQEVLPYLKL